MSDLVIPHILLILVVAVIGYKTKDEDSKKIAFGVVIFLLIVLFISLL